MEEKKKDSIYELDGTVPLKKALPLGIQHILAMFLGNVSPLIIVCGMLEMSGVLKMTLIQNAMFVAGIATPVSAVSVLENRKRTANRNGYQLRLYRNSKGHWGGVWLRCPDGGELYRWYF